MMDEYRGKMHGWLAFESSCKVDVGGQDNQFSGHRRQKMKQYRREPSFVLGGLIHTFYHGRLDIPGHKGIDTNTKVAQFQRHSGCKAYKSRPR